MCAQCRIQKRFSRRTHKIAQTMSRQSRCKASTHAGKKGSHAHRCREVQSKASTHAGKKGSHAHRCREARCQASTHAGKKNIPEEMEKKNVCDDMSRAIAKESRIHGIYAANSRKFACCAAAHIAKQVASHVSMNEEDVKRILTPLQDSEILRIKKQWDVHMAMGANSQTCSTCGIIGLADPREYPLQNLCLNAFKVIGFCGCVFLIRCVTVLPSYAGFCRYMQGRARSCLVF